MEPQKDAKIEALYAAVRYLLDRAQFDDANLWYYTGPMTQARYLLCKAEAAYLDQTLAEVEERRNQCHIPERHRPAEVVSLRERCRELEEARS